jgi:nitroreductase
MIGSCSFLIHCHNQCMDFFEVIKSRRSVRRYTNTPVPEAVIEKAFEASLLAPNSSNLQTWKFFWVRSSDKKEKLVKACLSQGAARTAQELVVIVASPSLWKITSKAIIQNSTPPNSPKLFLDYYKKVVPFTYGYRFLAPIKWLIYNVIGLFRPIMRKPWSFRDVQEVAIKSACLASENFMLSITAQGFSTCPMEGFDEKRVKKILDLKSSDRAVMVISVGEADPKGIWGNQYRCPKEWFVFKV